MPSSYNRIRGYLSGLLALALAGCSTTSTTPAPDSTPATLATQPYALKAKPASFTASNDLVLNFINVGQGDCTLVEFPSGKYLLVDCGSSGGPFDGNRVRTYISQHLGSSQTIDLLVITHPDADHINKLVEVLASPSEPITVNRVMFNGSPSDYPEPVKTWLNSIPAERRIAVSGQDYNVYPPKKLPGFESDGAFVLAANVRATTSIPNARSIVLKISHGSFDAMLCGDATRATDTSILSTFNGHLGELDVEVWKAAHHGAWATAAQSSTWADAVKPETIVFSASSSNTTVYCMLPGSHF